MIKRNSLATAFVVFLTGCGPAGVATDGGQQGSCAALGGSCDLVGTSCSAGKYAVQGLCSVTEAGPRICCVPEADAGIDTWDAFGVDGGCEVTGCPGSRMCCYPCGIAGCANACLVPENGRCPLYP